MEIQKSSAVTTLKEILAIITGLTITNGLVVLVTGGNYQNIKNIFSFDLVPFLLFLALIFNVVRFYLGNVRLLDDCYLASFAGTPSEGTDRLKNLPLDYTMVLLSGILMALLSFYLRELQSFFAIFSIILSIDIVWFLLTWKDSHDPKIRNQRKWWTINNVGHVLPIAYGILITRDNPSVQWLIPFVAVVTNTAIDFALSWKFYFFTNSSIGRNLPKVFLAAPFTQTIEKKTGEISAQFRKELTAVYEALRKEGYEVFSAHVKEKWGAKLEDPSTALVRDLAELRDSDVLVAFIGSPPSPGVQMEIGAAITMNKPILYFVRDGENQPYLMGGVPMATRGLMVSYKTHDDAVKQLVPLLKSIEESKWIDQSI